MRINLRAPFFLAKRAAQEMIAQGAGGSIISISSLNVAYALEHVAVYGATKAGISQMTRHMALEWAEYGIRVNAIAPGFMDTPLAEPIWADPETSRWIHNRVPMERPGAPSELVGACLLLASDAGSFLTGQTLIVDGGAEAGGRWFHPTADTERRPSMRIAVVGAGAMGSIFGTRSPGRRRGHARRRRPATRRQDQRRRRNGRPRRRRSTSRVPATNDPSCVGVVDAVIFFAKCYHTAAAAELAQPLVGPDTVVASLQNGWGNGDVLAAAFPPEQVVVGVTYNSGLIVSRAWSCTRPTSRHSSAPSSTGTRTAPSDSRRRSSEPASPPR